MEQKIMDSNWMKDPRVKQISPEKLAVITLLVEQSSQKTPEEFLSLLIKTNSALEQAHLSLTKEERNLLLDVMKQKMSPIERKKIEMIQAMISK